MILLGRPFSVVKCLNLQVFRLIQFNPPPKVLSAVIRLTRNETAQLDCDEKLFWQLVKAGFNQRRKTLRNAISSVIPKDKITEDPLLDLRAERLSVADFVKLTNMVSDQR